MIIPNHTFFAVTLQDQKIRPTKLNTETICKGKKCVFLFKDRLDESFAKEVDTIRTSTEKLNDPIKNEAGILIFTKNTEEEIAYWRKNILHDCIYYRIILVSDPEGEFLNKCKKINEMFFNKESFLKDTEGCSLILTYQGGTIGQLQYNKNQQITEMTDDALKFCGVKTK